jgi:polyisoprenoid-binding protein YceI
VKYVKIKTMTTYKIDAAHSEISFKVKHLMITNVSGSFARFDATLETENGDFSGAVIRFTADTDSLGTGNEQRDSHLKSDDFFNAEAFPQLSFVSTAFTKKDGGSYQLTGNMTIRDVTKELVLDVEYGGTTTDPWGQVKAGFEIKGKISRSAFGLKWNAVTEAGGVVVSDEVRLALEVQMVKQA